MRQVVEVWAKTHEEGRVNEIKKALRDGNVVELHNTHETFYGTGFGGWYEEQLKDIQCTIEVTEYDRWYGFERLMIIRPKK